MRANPHPPAEGVTTVIGTMIDSEDCTKHEWEPVPEGQFRRIRPGWSCSECKRCGMRRQGPAVTTPNPRRGEP